MIPPAEFYTTADKPTRQDRRGVSNQRIITAAKKAVTTLELAERLAGPGVGCGKELHFLCPLHDDHHPSLRVNPEQDLWYCDPCSVGGDVITLVQRAWDIDRADVAGAELLLSFGYEIPKRPEAWFARQQRQAPVRAAVEQTRRNVYRRRLFKYLVLPTLQHIQDDAEYVRELERAWREFEELLS
jgi:hypothetical protein